MMRDALKPKPFGTASALVAAAVDIVGYVWHGILRQPSFMDILYPGFWSNPALMAAGLIATLAGAYAIGYAFAWAYNKSARFS